MASVLPYGRTTPFSWDSLYVDVTEIPDSSYGYFQLVSLLVIYFALLWLGSYLIVSGSELLIFIPGMTSLVGAIILPVLGQLPMMLLSIFAGFGADAQAELEVGVGALAGGIVGQVSIYAFVSVLLGAVNFDAKTGFPDYSKKSKSTPTTTFYDYWFQTGVKMGKYTSTSTIFILVTAFPFVILMIPNIIYAQDRVSSLTTEEKPYDIFGFVFAFVLFIIFAVNQYIIMNSNEDMPYFDIKDQIMVNSVRRKLLSLMSLLKKEVAEAEQEEEENQIRRRSVTPVVPLSPGEQSPLVDVKLTTNRLANLKEKLRRIIAPFLTRETVASQKISMSDLLLLFYELGERHMTLTQLRTIFTKYLPSPKASTSIEFPAMSNKAQLDELAALELPMDDVLDGLASFLTHYKEYHDEHDELRPPHEPDNPFEVTIEDMGEFPQDLSELSNDDQLFYLRLRASLYLVGGLLLSIYAVDPIILAIDELSSRLGISSFYVSFVIVGGVDVPTLLAIQRYGTKRSERTASICQDTILGSVITLNTLGLGTFMTVVYARGLAWEYLAEAATILISLVLASILFFKESQTVFDGFLLFLLFPLALGIVITMRSNGYT